MVAIAEISSKSGRYGQILKMVSRFVSLRIDASLTSMPFALFVFDDNRLLRVTLVLGSYADRQVARE